MTARMVLFSLPVLSYRHGMTSVTLLHVGGPTLLIETAGLRFLTDPTFDKAPQEYPSPRRVFRKTADPAVTETGVGHIDAVLLSHDQHVDNLDGAGRRFLKSVPDVYTTLSGAARLDGPARGLKPWDSVRIPAGTAAVTLTAMPARHGKAGIESVAGDVVGFLLEIPNARGDLYISGDTVFYEDVAEIGRRRSIALAVVHLGGVRLPADQSLMTMDAESATRLARTMGSPPIVPVHYEGWEHFEQTREAAETAFGRLRYESHVHWLVKGVSTTFEI